MRYKSIFILFLSIFWISSILFSAESVSAQNNPKQPDRRKTFGNSLYKRQKATDSKSPEKSAENPEKSSENPDDEIIKVKTDLVVNDILVASPQGSVILGLQKDDFILTEDGVKQELELFSFGENANLPRSIVLVMDYSGSQIPFIKNSVEAAKLLVDKLAPQNKMAIVTDDVKLLVDFTTDKIKLKKELDSLSKKALSKQPGLSQQYTALVVTLQEMFAAEDVRPVIIFQTDGDELSSLKDAKPPEGSTKIFSPLFLKFQKPYSYADIYRLSARSRATIYSIVPGLRLLSRSPDEQQNGTRKMLADSAELWYRKRIEPTAEQVSDSIASNLQQQSALLELSKVSGGYMDYLELPEDAGSVYSNIFTIISNRYVVGYYPTNQVQDGKARTVKIEVRGHPEYTIVGRKYYYSQNENASSP